MSSSDSDSSDGYSSNSSAGQWPWHIAAGQSESEENGTSEESSSEDSSDECTADDSWTNRRNVFISIYKCNNYTDAILITNYNEVHNYRNKYAKLPKKTADNVKTIWNDIKINVQNVGIVPLKSYEKKLIQKTKTVVAKKPIGTSKQNGAAINEIKLPIVTQNQSSKATSQPVTSNQVTSKSMQSNKTSKSQENDKNIKTKNRESDSTKVDKPVKGDVIVLSVIKSESDKKKINAQSTNPRAKLNGSNTNYKINSNELEFKKLQTKVDPKKIKSNKNNSKEIISEIKSKKRKCSENSDHIQKRSSSMDSRKSLTTKKKTVESDTHQSDNDDEEEIIDNMDALTGNSETVNDKMLELVKYKDKKKLVKTLMAADEKIDEKNNEKVNNDLSSSISQKNNVLNSEKIAEEAIDMIMKNDIKGALDNLLEALQFNPGDDRHYINRCYCYLRINKPNLALADAQYLLQTSTHYDGRFIAYMRAGQASMALQKYTQAENFLKDALTINSDNLYAQRELIRAKISKIVSLGYTERNAVLALLKYSKTQEAINYLVNKNIVNNENKSDNYDDSGNLDDLIYSSDEDEKPNSTTMINNMINYEPGVTKFSHFCAKSNNTTTNTLLPTVPSNKNANCDNKKKNIANGQVKTGYVMDKTIWVGSLTKSITEAMLKKKFKQFGTVISVYCPTNEAYAFVNFEKSEHVANVLKNPSTHEINGVKLVIRQGVNKK